MNQRARALSGADNPRSDKWPKRFPPLTPEQEAIRSDFLKTWLEVLPRRYGAIERFNHQYSLKTWSPPAAVQKDRRPRTLEIGAGLGAHLGYEDLTRQDYYAIELRENILKVLQTRYPGVHTVLGNIEEGTSFADGYFDRVIAIHVLEHLSNLPAALDEIHRVLGTTGVLSVVLPCEGGWGYTLARYVSAQRLFEKTYHMPYKGFIEREHVNTLAEVVEELEERFRVTHERRWPLPGMPVAFNLVVGLTLVPK